MMISTTVKTKMALSLGKAMIASLFYLIVWS